MFIKGNDIAKLPLNLSLVSSFRIAGDTCIMFTIPGTNYSTEWQYKDKETRDNDLIQLSTYVEQLKTITKQTEVLSEVIVLPITSGVELREVMFPKPFIKKFTGK